MPWEGVKNGCRKLKDPAEDRIDAFAGASGG